MLQALLERLEALPHAELTQLCREAAAARAADSDLTASSDAAAAFSASFMFWLAAEERRAAGPRRRVLAELGARLVSLKEAAGGCAAALLASLGVLCLLHTAHCPLHSAAPGLH